MEPTYLWVGVSAQFLIALTLLFFLLLCLCVVRFAIDEGAKRERTIQELHDMGRQGRDLMDNLSNDFLRDVYHQSRR